MASKTMTRDLTQGSPLKLLLGFSLPLLGGLLFQQLYSFIDTAIVGRFLGYDALAAVGSSRRRIRDFCVILQQSKPVTFGNQHLSNAAN